MIDFAELLLPTTVIADVTPSSKKAVIQHLAGVIAQAHGLDAKLVSAALAERERIGSTGFGGGIAIPHAKFKGLDRIHCLVARLDQPIEFESLDNEPVDLIFVLLAPEHASGDHLKALARISRLLREPSALERLRAARDAKSLYAVLTQPVTSHAA